MTEDLKYQDGSFSRNNETLSKSQRQALIDQASSMWRNVAGRIASTLRMARTPPHRAHFLVPAISQSQ